MRIKRKWGVFFSGGSPSLAGGGGGAGWVDGSLGFAAKAEGFQYTENMKQPDGSRLRRQCTGDMKQPVYSVLGVPASTLVTLCICLSDPANDIVLWSSVRAYFCCF